MTATQTSLLAPDLHTQVPYSAPLYGALKGHLRLNMSKPQLLILPLPPVLLNGNSILPAAQAPNFGIILNSSPVPIPYPSANEFYPKNVSSICPFFRVAVNASQIMSFFCLNSAVAPISPRVRSFQFFPWPPRTPMSWPPAPSWPPFLHSQPRCALASHTGLLRLLPLHSCLRALVLGFHCFGNVPHPVILHKADS